MTKELDEDAPELKSCKFCGRKSHFVIRIGDVCEVECGSCHEYKSYGDTYYDAVRVWNRRVGDDA